MPTDAWMRADQSALFTDLYQLTMLQAYVREGMQEEAVFDLFIRRQRERAYFLACGLETVLAYLESVRFTSDAIDYLKTLGLFADDFLEYLAHVRFTGSVYAVREGTPVFAGEPLLQVVAPIGEAQLVETFLLNQITFQTGIASKASRVVHAAQGRPVADFGMRRMHGADAPLKAVRAYHIAGVASTSNVLAGQLYGMPVTGTMAHSYIEAHASEAEAFRAFASLYPGTTLLVDTYDTVDGVRRLIDLVTNDGLQVGAIRLDSGDLADLARQARRLLDAAGLDDVKIFASGSLDEHAIADLLASEAPIDAFGVGTRMGTMADQPYLDSAYKLSAYAGEGRMKLSTNKSNLPGRKQLYRHYADGLATHDVLAAADEPADGEPLLELVMQDGRRTDAGRRTLDEARTHAESSLKRLPEQLHALDAVEPYRVVVSKRLQTEAERLRAALADGSL